MSCTIKQLLVNAEEILYVDYGQKIGGEWFINVGFVGNLEKEFLFSTEEALLEAWDYLENRDKKENYYTLDM